MIAIKRSISFTPEVKASANDPKALARVRCVVTWNGQRVRLATGHSVNPEYWIKDLQRCRAKTFHGRYKVPATTINHNLDDLETLINGIFHSFEEKDTIPSKDDFNRAYTVLTEPVPSKEEDKVTASLFPIYDEYIEDGIVSGRWSKGTLVKCRTIRNHLYSISPNLSLKELISIGTNALIKHFSKVKSSDTTPGLANTTIKNDIAFVKCFLRWAQEKDYCDASPFLKARVKLKTAVKPVIFLTQEELLHVYNFDFGHKKYLSQVRDVFCFCCFTSLRYSDVYNLKRSNITETEIKITTVKTHDSITIELNQFSKAILDKYSGVDFPDGKALPVITNQKMNEYLKELGKICGLDSKITITRYKGQIRVDKTFKKYELLSTHCARRAFVCNALMLGIPANIVMQWTGHSDYKTMKPYIAIADDARKTAMTAFNSMGNHLPPQGAKGGAK